MSHSIRSRLRLLPAALYGVYELLALWRARWLSGSSS